MRRALLAVLLCAIAVAVQAFHARGSFILAGEPIVFDERLQPSFTENQIRSTDAATREGLVRWAATEEGQKLIARFNHGALRVIVHEDTTEESAGRARQRGLATLGTAGAQTKIKSYDLILNPAFGASRGFDPVRGMPSRPADFMAAAWGGEMLHIYFYSQGISLPHHERADFQEEWHQLAGQLGYPTLPHEADRPAPERPARGRVARVW